MDDITSIYRDKSIYNNGGFISRKALISVRDLPFNAEKAAVAETEKEAPATLQEATEEIERRMIREALASANGNQTRAAEMLGISERMLRYKLKKYSLK